MSKIYYNEIEPFACHWLEHLMALVGAFDG